jgi:hypothetical protein
MTWQILLSSLQGMKIWILFDLFINESALKTKKVIIVIASRACGAKQSHRTATSLLAAKELLTMTDQKQFCLFLTFIEWTHKS